MKNEEITKLENKISNLEICPTCLQDVDAVYRANVLNKIRGDFRENMKKIEELEENKKSILNKIKSIEDEIMSKEKKVADLKIMKMRFESIKEKKSRVEEIKKLNETIKKDILLLEKHIESLNNSVVELKKFEPVFEKKRLELEEALRKERIAEIKLAELRKEIEEFSKQIKELKDRIAKTEEIKRHIAYLSELEGWLSKNFVPLIAQIEKNVMNKLKTEFSKLFSEWFSMLVSDSFNVRMDDNFTPIIEQQDYEIDYAYLSGGERTAVALAYRLALNQVINSVLSRIKTKDLVILDEPTDGFSEQQLDKMRDVLQQLNVRQLIIVSHEQKIESFVENIIRFKKENGVSKIE